MIQQPLHSLTAWADAFTDAEVLVLSASVTEVAQLLSIEEARGTMDAHTLAEALAPDPLMTVKVLAHVSRYCTQLRIEPPETLVSAIIMQGIGPFFTAQSSLRAVETDLADHPSAIEGLQRVMTRARRAANFAMGFALKRQDQDALVIQEAALLHDFAEMLLWCHAPKLALEVAQRLQADHTLRSAEAQRTVLGIELGDLAQELMRRWQLPKLLIRCTDDHQAHDPQVRTTMLGVRIARHTQHGWDVPHALAALPDDAADVGRLLNIAPDAALRLIQGLDQ
jgi:HD-like signal output (HDOD) protein